jgi:hypothetical protein
VSSTGVVEEPISSELALVDQALARRARAALPEPPWLLPVLAELQEAARTEPAPVAPAPTAPPARERPAPRRRSRWALGLSVVLVLAAAAALALAFLPLSEGPTVVKTPVRNAAPAVPARPPAVVHPKRASKPPAAKPKPKPVRKKAPVAPVKHRTTRAKSQAPRPTVTAKPKPEPAKPRTLTRAERVVSWHRNPSAVFYELHLQRGAATIYEARTAAPRALLPARISLKPGVYRVVVRPAIPSDAGIILGAPILRRTLKV